MVKLYKTIKWILKMKNDQIRNERKKLQAAECENSILAAYIAVLVAGNDGKVTIAKSDISEALGRASVHVVTSGQDYIIEVKSSGGRICGNGVRDGDK